MPPRWQKTDAPDASGLHRRTLQAASGALSRATCHLDSKTTVGSQRLSPERAKRSCATRAGRVCRCPPDASGALQPRAAGDRSLLKPLTSRVRRPRPPPRVGRVRRPQRTRSPLPRNFLVRVWRAPDASPRHPALSLGQPTARGRPQRAGRVRPSRLRVRPPRPAPIEHVFQPAANANFSNNLHPAQ